MKTEVSAGSNKLCTNVLLQLQRVKEFTKKNLKKAGVIALAGILVISLAVVKFHSGKGLSTSQNVYVQVKNVKVQSIDNLSELSGTLTIELNKNQKPKEKWDELRKKVSYAETSLPDVAQKPQVNDNLSKNFVQTLSITANSFADLYAARTTIDDMKNELKTVEGVADVSVVGMPGAGLGNGVQSDYDFLCR